MKPCGSCQFWIEAAHCPRLRHAEHQAAAYIAAHSRPGKAIRAKQFDGTGATSPACGHYAATEPSP